MANAQLTKLADAGIWQTIGGSQGGHQSCALTSVSGAPGSIVMFVRDDTPGLIKLAFHKEGWAIPADIRIPIVIRFNDGFSVPLTGTGNQSSIDVNFPGGLLKAWVHSFTAGRSMMVEFTGGSEPPWSLDLAGTTPAISAMVKCISDASMAGLPPPFALSETVSAQPTQPFATARNGETQPFGGAVTPSAPVTPAYTSPPVASRTPPVQNAFSNHVGTTPSGANGPEQEAEFVRAVAQFANAYDAASNEFAKGAQRQARARAICSILSGRSVQNWIGHIKSLSSSSSGDGVLKVSIAPDITLETYNNSFSDMEEHTLIKANAPFYADLSQAKEGASVIFSGNLISSADDCIKEASITQAGSMQDPDFIFHFSDVRIQ